MSLTLEELSDLEKEIVRELPDNMLGILTKLNRTGRLDEFLDMIGMKHLVENDNAIQTFKNGKIVVVGGSEVKEDILLGIAKKLGIDKDRFEFCLDYDRIQKYDFRKMQYSPVYRVILFGPTPHSGTGKEDRGSIISEIENSKAYPRVERLMNGSELKITKSNFRDKLLQLQEEDYI